MGSRAVVIVCRDRAGGLGTFRDRRRGRDCLYPHGPPLLLRHCPGNRVPRPDSGGYGRQRLLVAVQHGLGLPGLRVDALVGQGPGTAAFAVCRRGCRGPGVVAESGRGTSTDCGDGWRTRTRPASPAIRRMSRSCSGDSENRGKAIEQFVTAYRQYCWPVKSLDDLKLAPFHLLATEGKVHTDQDHVWHMETLAAMCRHDPILLLATPLKIVDLTDPEGQKPGVDWWLELTGRGGEGMVVKPHEFVASGSEGIGPAGSEMPRPGIPADHLRPRIHVPGEPVTVAASEAWQPSGPWPCGSLPWVSRVSNASCGKSRCGGSTSAFSACWLWRASRSIRDCRVRGANRWEMVGYARSQTP